jgi:phosphohistidine phosphatase
MLVGHNPGIESFVRFLTGQLEPFPTAALAVIDLDVDSWDLLGEGRGELREIYRPKEMS